MGSLKFNIDGVTRGKPGSAGIGSVLYSSKYKVLFMFSKFFSIRDSNKAEVLPILAALHCF